MPTLAQLGQLLTASRVVTAEAWQRAVAAGGNDLARTLDALAAIPAWWATDPADPHPSLTDYHKSVIELWWDDPKFPLARHLALNQFLILNKLGQGGQGEVYRARQLNPARFVAVKTLTQETESRRRRFEQEAKTMMRVRHPGVARFHLYERVRDANNVPTDEYLIAMEYVEGTDLYRLVQEHGPVPWRFAIKWAVDLLGGLAVIHDNGFIHRDVKPANIMVLGPVPGPRARVSDTAAKMLDFGAVKHADTPVPGSGVKRVFIGTREYAPPEQWAERVVPASDIYALGASLYHALTGRPPYEVEGRAAAAFMKAHARAPIPDARDYDPDIPPDMSLLLTRMMAKKADDRSTAAELAEEFRRLLPTEARAEPLSGAKTKVPPAAKPKPAAVAVPEADEPEEKSAVHAVLHPFLAVLERIFLPAHLRPAPGHEPAVSERMIALLRRPLLLLALLVLIGLLIFLIR